MSILAKVAKNMLFGGVAGLVGDLFGKKKRGPAALPVATRDDAAEAVAADDTLRRRKGAAADMITGMRGAEAASGTGKMILGS